MKTVQTITILLLFVIAAQSASLPNVVPSLTTTLGRSYRNKQELGLHFAIKAGPTFLFKGKKSFALLILDNKFTSYRALTPHIAYHFNKEDEKREHLLGIGGTYMFNSTLKGPTVSIGSELLITNNETKRMGGRVSTKLGILNSLGVEIAYQKHIRSELQVSLFCDIGAGLFLALNIW